MHAPRSSFWSSQATQVERRSAASFLCRLFFEVLFALPCAAAASPASCACSRRASSSPVDAASRKTSDFPWAVQSVVLVRCFSTLLRALPSVRWYSWRSCACHSSLSVFVFRKFEKASAALEASGKITTIAGDSVAPPASPRTTPPSGVCAPHPRINAATTISRARLACMTCRPPARRNL